MASAVSNLHAGSNARFNREALAWDSNPLVHKASGCGSEAITARLDSLPNLPKDLQVLEIGCGTGVLSCLLAKDARVKRIVAVDAAEGMVNVLKTKVEKKDEESKGKILPVAVLLEDPEDPALPPSDDGGNERQKFDLITSHLVLHHIPELVPVLKTMYGCLRPGGRVMLTDFEDFGPQARRFHPKAKMDGVFRHGINVKAMKALMEEIGFKEVDVKEAWRLEKDVEKFEGEYGDSGRATEGKGEMMEFPFVLCYGVKT